MRFPHGAGDSTEPLEPNFKSAVEVVHVLDVNGTSYPFTRARKQSLMLDPPAGQVEQARSASAQVPGRHVCDYPAIRRVKLHARSAARAPLHDVCDYPAVGRVKLHALSAARAPTLPRRSSTNEAPGPTNRSALAWTPRPHRVTIKPVCATL